MTAAESKRDLSKRLHAQFTIAIGNRRYTPTPNTILDARVRNTDLTIEERFDALLERTSMGNWSLFACKRDWDTGLATPLTQGDFAEILKVDKRRISAVVGLRQKQGFVKVNPANQNGYGRPLYLDLDPVVEGRPGPADATVVTWKAFSERWDRKHADLVKHKAAMLAKAHPFLAVVAEIDAAKLAEFRKMRREERPEAGAPSEPSDQSVLDFSDYESGTPATEVLDSLDDLSATPPTNSPAISYIENSKQQQQEVETKTQARTPSEELVVVAKMGVTEETARKFLKECQTQSPGCTLVQITAVIDEVKSTISKNVRNPAGILLTQVPGRIAAYRARSEAEEIVDLPGFRPMPKAEAVALLREALRAEEPDVREWAAAELRRLGQMVEMS